MLNKFKHRSSESELLDAPNIPEELLFQNLRELDFINRTLGGHSITMSGIKKLVTEKNKTYHIVDLGCGSGDALKAIADWARSNNFNVRLTGVDRNANAIEYLKNHCVNYPEISGITADYQDYLNRNEFIEIVHCSLFCHHLKDDELLRLFIYFRQHVKSGFIINDLHRHWLAYYSAWFFTRLLNGTVLAKNDGPVSILRGFKSNELKYLLNKANISNYSIQKEGVFRYLIISKTS